MKLPKLAIIVALAGSLLMGASSLSAYPTDTPSQYFNDYAHVLSPERDKQLNDQLADYERKTSNQFVVAVEPDATLSQPIEQIGLELARKWGIGQKGSADQVGSANRNNGVLFLVFPNAHKMRLEVNRGMEGSLPDTAANDILHNIVAPQFKANNFDAGLTNGINAVISRLNTEGNKGVNRTVDEQKRDRAAHQANNNNDRNTVATSNTESSGGFGFFGIMFTLIVLGIIGYVVYRLFFKSENTTPTSNSNINDSFDSYHNNGYTPPAPAPYVPPAPPVRREYERTYSSPSPAPTRSHGVGTFVAGAAAGALADELLSTNRRKKSSDDDTSSTTSYSGTSSSWDSSPSTSSSSSSSSSDSSPSYSSSSSSDSSSSSSWSDSSSSSSFDSGGSSDFGGGGSSSDW